MHMHIYYTYCLWCKPEVSKIRYSCHASALRLGLHTTVRVTHTKTYLGVDVRLVRFVFKRRPVALVVVLVSVEEEIDPLVKEQLFEAIGAVVPWSCSSNGLSQYHAAVTLKGLFVCAVTDHSIEKSHI